MLPRKPVATPADPADEASTAGRFVRTVSQMEAAAVIAVQEARLTRSHFAAAQMAREGIGPIRRLLFWLRGRR